MIRNLRATAVLGLLLVAGCESSTATSTGSSANAADLQFATGAAQIIKFDQEECTLAETQAKNPEVRALAAKLLQEANDFQARLEPAAAEAGIKLPNTLDDMRRIRISHMRLQNGLDFDRTFLADQIASHQDVLDMAESMPVEDSSSLAGLARQARALIAANQQKLIELQRQM